MKGTLLDAGCRETDCAIGCEGTTKRIGTPLEDAVDFGQMRRGHLGSVEAVDWGGTSFRSGVAGASCRLFSPTRLPDSWGTSLYCTSV